MADILWCVQELDDDTNEWITIPESVRYESANKTIPYQNAICEWGEVHLYGPNCWIIWYEKYLEGKVRTVKCKVVVIDE